MVFIYTIGLAQGKYYVGKTTNPSFTIDMMSSSAWTTKYNPMILLELIHGCDDYDEDKYTIKYMDMYGINNVRGGSFTSVILNDSTIEHLTLMSRKINASYLVDNIENTNKTEVKYCTLCNREGHREATCVLLHTW